jgi:hypothetical protein
MSTEYSYTCDRCFLLAPGPALVENLKGAKNWSPDGWRAVRVMDDDGETHLHFCPECSNQFSALVTEFCNAGKVVNSAPAP